MRTKIILIYAGMIITLLAAGTILYGRPPVEQFTIFKPAVSAADATFQANNLPADQLRQLALHDAGRLWLPIVGGGFPPRYGFLGPYDDSETGEDLFPAIYPTGTRHYHLYSSSLWIGGIVGDDTLVSVSNDGLYGGICEFWPPDPEQGGLRRAGRFADDEFLSVFTDTVTNSRYVGFPNPYDPDHMPLGIEIRQTSYSWSDTLYDDFVILTFTVDNIGGNLIEKGWIGFFVDPDIYDINSPLGFGWTDDASGCLDTFLYDDPENSALIPYAFDLNGDPGPESQWDEHSIRSVISLRLLDCSVPGIRENFNWWEYNNTDARDFGPRLLGTPEDPFRTFSAGVLGTPRSQRDKYYILSHAEVDYNEIEVNVHDSTDGWLPAPMAFTSMNHDTRFLYSFGPFDLAPGDSMTFAVAFIAGDYFHTNADDYDLYFNADVPDSFQQTLNFADLLVQHRRADSAYRSGFTLPVPGPPVGLQVTDYNDDYITLAWSPSGYPSIQGYYLNVRDTAYDNIWHRLSIEPITDTGFTFPVYLPSHELSFAVSLIDSLGRESNLSRPVSFITGTPRAPVDVTVHLDGLTPILTWMPPNDTGLLVYKIYRSTWQESYALYDSTVGLAYHDLNIESGIRYNYMITAINDRQLESLPSDPVSTLPMALEKRVLFYDMNYADIPTPDAFRRENVDRLLDLLRSGLAIDYYDIGPAPLTFKALSRYELVIFDAERRGGQFYIPTDSLVNYLAGGGKALFIIPNASTTSIPSIQPRLERYFEGSFFHDYLRLDSARINALVLQNSHLLGDLMGCVSQNGSYPNLTADSSKLIGAPIPIDGYIPLSGCLYPRDGIDTLYTYQSLYPDSIFHGQINGYRHLSDTCKFIYFAFPLTLMEETTALAAIRQALTDLGFDLDCGDVNIDGRVNVGDAVFLLNYLFRGGPPPSDARRADVDCDAEITVADALVLINLVFKDGLPPVCCQ